MSQESGGPQRTCLGCREVMSRSELCRIVRAPDGEVLVDLRGKLPGRGASLCWNRGCIEAAVRRRAFDRAFRQPCRPVTADQFAEVVCRELVAHLASLLGMARKSAQFVAGSNAVLDALGRRAPLAVVIVAGDISPQIGEKVGYKAAAAGVETTVLFDKAELGRILGRAERSVVGLPVGQLADAFLGDLRRYREISGDN